MRLRSLALYRYAAEVALERGIIIADTKFEFGMLDGEVTLIDEALTPDSSRFWPVDQYEPGRDQPSFDKQPLRDWLTASGWDKRPPPPDLPPEVVQRHLGTLHRGVPAADRRTAARLDATHEESTMPDYRARIDVMLKPLVNDPQGLAVRDGLHTLGFGGVSMVRVGKHIEVTIAARYAGRRRASGPLDVRAASRQPGHRGLPLRGQRGNYGSLAGLTSQRPQHLVVHRAVRW